MASNKAQAITDLRKGRPVISERLATAAGGCGNIGDEGKPRFGLTGGDAKLPRTDRPGASASCDSAGRTALQTR